MALLIDTSVLIDAERRNRSLSQALGSEDRAISVITASELLHGVRRTRDRTVRTRRAAFVEHLLSAVEALPITMAVARIHAEIWTALKGDGNLIGAHDLWIAATALRQGMALATVNVRDLERVPGLTVVPV
ncbi:MAG TPA: PIN domain-containing protein [Solirubrobacterales bacterium]|nr:PIN domain-containing protein [Solirubrobacterales bacterium]